MTGYYDYVLGFIPAALLGITTTLMLAGISLTTAVPLASTVAVAAMGHAMFVNGPVDRSPESVVRARSPEATTMPDTPASPNTQVLNAD
ncbi:MAG: hypothetical protein ABEJ74_03220 [Haloferacaceae archaeon]